MFKNMLFVFLLCYSSVTLACTCGKYKGNDPDKIEASFKEASSVLLAKVILVENLDPEEITIIHMDEEDQTPKKVIRYNTQETQFMTIRSWKGIQGKKFKTRIAITGGLCGKQFKKGESYLLYLYGPNESEFYSTNICSRTRELNDSLNDEISLLDSNHLTSDYGVNP